VHNRLYKAFSYSDKEWLFTCGVTSDSHPADPCDSITRNQLPDVWTAGLDILPRNWEVRFAVGEKYVVAITALPEVRALARAGG
jgi:hypothetical protein